MGFFSKTLQAAMPKMIGNPITTAVAMVSVALSVVKGKKAKKATKSKKKATVRKSKIVSKKQKQQMEVMERIYQSAYGTYIRGATTVAARYIGHPAVAIPASEMVKTMMDEVAPPINKYCVIHTEQKQKIATNDIVQIVQIYKNAIEERKQYLKDKKRYIPTIDDYNMTMSNAAIQSIQYLMDKYCPEWEKTIDNIKIKKEEFISNFYENNRQIYIKNPEIGTVFDKMLFDVPIDEKNMNVFEKAEVAMDGVASGFIKDIASGANAIVDMALSPLDTAEALTSPGALTLGTVWNGLTEDIVNDWQKGTIQGKTEAVGRTISIISPIEILKATGIIGKGTKVAGTLGKTANVVDTAVDVTRGIADVADTAVDLTKKITDVGDTAVDITKGLEETADGLANTGKNFTDDITKKFESTNSAKKSSIETDDVLQQKPDKTPEQKPKEAPEQKPNETPEQNTKKPSETDDIITVEKGNSGVNGHDNVEFSGAKPKSNINDVKTTEKCNNEKCNNKPDGIKTTKDSSTVSKENTINLNDDNSKVHQNAIASLSVRKEGRKTIYTNPSGNEVSWIDQTSKDIESIVNSKLNSSKPGDILEGQVAQVVKETEHLKGSGLSIERPNGSKAGDIDVLTDSYIIEVKKSFAAVDKKQFDKLTNPQNADYFNFDGKGIIYYIEDSTIKNPYNQKTLEMLQSSENVTVVHTLDDLKGVILK